MKLNDVANQLRLLIPRYTTRFSDYLTASSIVSNGSVTTIVFSAAHGLVTGQWLIFNGVARKTPISAFSKSVFDFTFTTSRHDLTMNWYRDPGDRDSLNQVQLGGFTVAAWNGIHTLKAVPNRETFTIQSALDAPVLNGNEYILEMDVGGLYGNKQITVTNSTTITISGSITEGTYLGGTICQMPRIAVAVNAEDAWNRIQTPLANNKFAMILLPKDVVTSKDRNSYSDAVSARVSGEDFRLKLLDGFIILIIAPTHQQFSGATALDYCRHDMQAIIFKSIMGLTPDTGTADTGDYKIIPVTHGVETYDISKLVYRYEFQYPYDLTSNDTIPPAQTSAFRNVEYDLEVGDGMTVNVDLDDEPLD